MNSVYQNDVILPLSFPVSYHTVFLAFGVILPGPLEFVFSFSLKDCLPSASTLFSALQNAHLSQKHKGKKHFCRSKFLVSVDTV